MPEQSANPLPAPIRIGAVTYLNAQPLVYCLGRLAPQADICFDLPSRLADGLACGRLDVAIVPSIEYLRVPGCRIVSDACIACDGPVRSVKLYGRVPVQRIGTLALDEGSRTSAALTRILLKERFGLEPRLEALPIGATLEQSAADAIMLIGDRGMHAPSGSFEFVWDLGEEWTRWTGLPFVFALWVARPGVDLQDIAAALSAARDEGIARLAEIAHAAAPTVGIPQQECLAYLRDHLEFHLGHRQRQGLRLFYELAVRHRLAPSGGENVPLSDQEKAVVEEHEVNDERPHPLPLSQRERGEAVFTCGPSKPPVPLSELLNKAVAGRRLTPAEGLELLQSHDLAALAGAADAVARRLHPEPYRTYNIDRNINYTNICTGGCRFCAFSRRLGDPDGYVIDREELYRKIEETIALGGDQILLQGGMHPELDLPWYEELLRDIKRHFPQINVHGFSPPEIAHIAAVSGLSVAAVLARLKEAGLGSLPGGGAEILVDRVRKAVSPCKVSAEGWLDVCRAWHAMGGRGSATMMFGHLETLADRIEHLDRLRQLQDETGGFTAFICWTFQPGNTELPNLPKLGAFEYLKTLAVARLYLDNFANLQASWVTQGLKIGQMALRFGANDMGSLMIEENVVAAAGTSFRATEAEIRRAIGEAGYVPRRRNVFYDLIERV